MGKVKRQASKDRRRFAKRKFLSSRSRKKINGRG